MLNMLNKTMKSLVQSLPDFLILAAAGLWVLGCAPQNNMKGQDPKIQDGKIYSNRPQNREHFIAILKLKSPALLTDVKTAEDHTIQINEQLKQQIMDEQEVMVQKLTELSSEVKILNRYRLVLNALAVAAPIHLEKEITGMEGFSYIERETHFARAQSILERDAAEKEEGIQDLQTKNSVSFIGAHVLHQAGIKGQGLKVGVIDTGIDYTHAMFGGIGTEEGYKAINPDTPNESYPNEKIIGGIDLVGTKYNSAAPNFEQRLPLPDSNPLDEGGHGTHVAGTIAGHGDGINTYDGVAPEAKLHAIKVFGKDGSTGDTVIIAALEYAADPNGDLKLDDKLDVINLSLGSGYGKPHILYAEAIKNLVAGGTITVASAGNSGPNAYIVGAPSTVDEAISVAASVDYMDHNITFKAVSFKIQDQPIILAEAIEGAISKPISEVEALKGKLVYIGEAATELSEEQIASVKGHIAFIDRGKVAFAEKLERAFNAGAVGAVVANNVEGEPISMGGDKKFDIPAIMIKKSLADSIKIAMKASDVLVDFKTSEVIERPELVDSLTGFSSQGPRSLDSRLKPDLAAPGQNIISAKMGGGSAHVKMSGTSMAAPHMAGVMALLKQARPELDQYQLKSLAMETAKAISDKENIEYPVTMQGAGRVQVDKAFKAPLVILPASLSLGNLPMGESKLVRKKLSFTNTSSEDREFRLIAVDKKDIKIKAQRFSVNAGETKSITVEIQLNSTDDNARTQEMQTFLDVNFANIKVAHIPVLAVANKVSLVKAKKLQVYATSIGDAPGSAVDLTLTNEGPFTGKVLAFNSLGVDPRKLMGPLSNLGRDISCDLESAGHRVIEKEIDGKVELVFQVGVKLYNPITRWQPCEISVLIDADGDNIPEQELAGVIHRQLPGLPEADNYNSILLDAAKVRELRKQYELAYGRFFAGEETVKPTEDYTGAITNLGEMLLFDHSTISVIETPLKALKTNSKGELAIKVGILNEDRGAIEADDFLGGMDEWQTINPAPAGQSYTELPEVIEIASHAEITIPLTKGEDSKELLLLYPFNPSTELQVGIDQQLEIVEPNFN